mmetsp:Transcript_153012/g.281613  ORF Transcript_153012/g.281613 Transcript_153012/m.281613 type:complete len:758 (+) Transcript_153012:326-2599(+)
MMEQAQAMGLDLPVIASSDNPENLVVPLVVFKRAMVRLVKVLRIRQEFDWHQYDANKDGSVGWYEFCSFWQNSKTVVCLTPWERLFLTLDDSERSLMGRVMSILVFVTILVSMGCFIISTHSSLQTSCLLEHEPGHDPDCKPTTAQLFKDIDLACVVFFSVEYGARLLLSGFVRTELMDKDQSVLLEMAVSEESIRSPPPLQRMVDYFLNGANLIDLAAIMPWYLTVIMKHSGGGDSIIVRIIRLTRVIRAFRLGRRFEAVVIIMRSLNRSLRALNVLVLNLLLGVIIFSALMYFAEQGTWDPELEIHKRWVKAEWNETSRKWEDFYDRSPYDSIPACFWWAIVTATTVGYGDLFPTTAAGKAVAGICMAWSLCVLALPIGVIGNNFSQVWEEYDKEKQQEEWDQIREQMMLKRSLAWGDPLHYSQRLLLEVWHDSRIQDKECGLEDLGAHIASQAEFMGEVDCKLDLPPREHIIQKRMHVPLSHNFEKARRRVRGTITFEYTWHPQDGRDTDTLLQGSLEIYILHGDGLISIDWKGNFSSDPYCIVTAYPESPGENGQVEPKIFRTKTLEDTCYPEWNGRFHYDVNWTRAGADRTRALDMMALSGNPTNTNSSSFLTTQATSTTMSASTETALNSEEIYEELLPELRDEIRNLRTITAPQLKREINDVHQDMQSILNALRKRPSSNPSSASDIMHIYHEGGGKKQIASSSASTAVPEARLTTSNSGLAGLTESPVGQAEIADLSCPASSMEALAQD